MQLIQLHGIDPCTTFYQKVFLNWTKCAWHVGPIIRISRKERQRWWISEVGERRMTGGLESEESWMRGHLGHQALVQGHLGHQGNHGNRRRKGGGKVDER